MATLFWNPFRSRDKYFLACKIATLVISLPWPLTLLASVMSLAGQFQPTTPLYLRVLVRLGWLLVLVYPLVFLVVVFFAERVVACKSYMAAAVVAVLPIAFALMVVVWLIR
jgi:hypothetical protein